MSALTDNRNTDALLGDDLVAKIAVKNTEIMYAGGIAAMHTSTLKAEMASDTASLIVVGRVVAKVDNTADGESVEVERGIFRYTNSTGNALTRAHIGGACYVEDDQTVGSDGGTNNIVAGLVHDVDSSGVWVDQRPESLATARALHDAGSGSASAAITGPASAAALTQDTLTDSTTGVASTTLAAQAAATTHAITDSSTGTASTTEIAEITQAANAGSADIAPVENAVATLAAEDALIKADIATVRTEVKTYVASLAAQLAKIKTDVAAVRTGSEANNTAIDSILAALVAQNIIAAA